LPISLWKLPSQNFGVFGESQKELGTTPHALSALLKNQGGKSLATEAKRPAFLNNVGRKRKTNEERMRLLLENRALVEKIAPRPLLRTSGESQFRGRWASTVERIRRREADLGPGWGTRGGGGTFAQGGGGGGVPNQKKGL